MNIGLLETSLTSINGQPALADVQEAARFLRLLDADADDFEFRTFDDSEDKRGAFTRKMSGSLDDVAHELAGLNARGAGVFVVANAGGQTDAQIDRVRAVFVDTDGAPFDPIMACGLEPHIVVETSPGRWHFYWLVEGLPLGEFTSIQESAIRKFGTDKSVKNLSRVMRLPGFDHRKAEPHRVRIIHESGGLPYSAERVRTAFPPVAATCPAPKPGVEHVGALVHIEPTVVADLRSALAHLRADERADWIAVGAALRELGEVGRGLWVAWSQTSEAWRPEDARIWATLAHDRTGHVAVFARAQRAGWVNPRSEAATTSQKRDLGKASTSPLVWSAADLLLREFQPVQWGLKGLLPEGISILSGDPKIGKSWLVYQGAVAVATRSPLWPGRDPEEQGDVLLLALEDNDRRLRRRLDILLPHFSPASAKADRKGATFTRPDVSRLHYATEWPRAEAGVAHLTQWMRAHPGVRLVVIDTISAFRDPEPGRKSAYATDYAVGEMLKPLAREFNAAIVLVMHNRKQASDDALQMVSGTQGMTGGVDNVLVLKRERGTMDAGLYVDGRDIEEPQELAMRFRNGLWSSDGESVEKAQRSKERRRVLAVVAELGSEARVRAIGDALHPQKYGAVKKMLTMMVKSGELKNEDGVYVPTHIR